MTSSGPIPPNIATKYTTNDGNFAVPLANNLNVFGTDSASGTAPDGFSPYTTSSGSTVTIHMPGYARWVVNPVSGLGTHTTPQAAINAASAGDDVFLTAGTYTGNITLKSGVNLFAFPADANLNGNFDTVGANVIINGTCTFTGTGTVNISGIQLTTNAAPLLTVSGSSASVVNLTGCYLNIANNGGIAFTSTSASAEINICYCTGNINGAFAPFTMNSPGTMYFGFCDIENSSGNPTIPGTLANGNIQIENSLLKFPISMTSGSISMSLSQINPGNTTGIAMTGGTLFAQVCHIGGGTSASVTIGTGATATLNACMFQSTNATAAISGAGTLNYSGLDFMSSGSNITVTTQNALVCANSAIQIKIPGSYPYTVLPQDAFIPVDTTSSRTINLTASPSTGQIVTLKDNNSSAQTNNITVQGNGHNIDGASSLVINTINAAVTFVFNGTQWNSD